MKLETDKNVGITAHESVGIDAKKAVSIRVPLVTLDAAKVICTGDVVVDGDVMASGISLVKYVHGGVKQWIHRTEPPL